MATQPNNLEVTDWLSMEGLRLLLNKTEVLPMFNTDFDKNLDKEFPVGASFRVPLPNLGKIRNGLAYNPQPIIDRHVTIACDQVVGWDVEWDSVELALSMPRSEARLKKKILVPATKQIRQEWDSRAANFATQNTPNIVGTLGTNPATFDAVYGAADQRLTELAGNDDDDRKGMFLSPGVARTLRASAVSYFHPGSELERMWKSGYIGETTGFKKNYQSMSLYSTSGDAWAGTVEVTQGGQSGSSLTLTCTSGDTFTQGTPFKIAGVNAVNPMTLRSTGSAANFVFASTVAGAANTATVTIYPAIVGPGSPYQNVDALPIAGADLTQYPGTTTPETGPKSGFNGLALTLDAFAVVFVKLQNPKESSAEIVSQTQDPDTKMALAFLRMFDPISRKWVNRFDTCGGFGVLQAANCAVRVLGA